MLVTQIIEVEDRFAKCRAAGGFHKRVCADVSFYPVFLNVYNENRIAAPYLIEVANKKLALCCYRLVTGQSAPVKRALFPHRGRSTKTSIAKLVCDLLHLRQCGHGAAQNNMDRWFCGWDHGGLSMLRGKRISILISNRR